MPDSVYKSLVVPSLANVELKKIKQFYSYDESIVANEFEPVKSEFKNLETLKHLQMQVDHLEGTNFVQVTLLIDTNQLSKESKIYLELFTNLLFESPIVNKEINLTHEEVVYELNRDLLEFGSSLGINGSQLDPGIYSEYFTIFTKVLIIYENFQMINLLNFFLYFKRFQFKIMNLQSNGSSTCCLTVFLKRNKSRWPYPIFSKKLRNESSSRLI